jgi:type IV pilus assembly protein PilM
LQIDFSIFNPKARPLLGLDISTSAVKMVELTETGKDSYRLERYGIEYLPRGRGGRQYCQLDAVCDAARRAACAGTSTRFVPCRCRPQPSPRR